MKVRQIVILLFLSTIVSGCGMGSLTYTMKGNHYMKNGDYQQAERTFTQAVQKTPDNALAHYYLGRFVLAQDKPAKALPSFQRAVQLKPGNAKYHFWLGLTYGELGDVKAEKDQYQKTLRLKKHYAQARLYLGHLQLKDGDLTKALQSYDAVLKQIPTNAAALYNRALILDMQKKTTKATKGWLTYLKWYPAGKHAISATDHLNALGDYSYNNHYLGRRTVTLAEIKFIRPKDSISVLAYPSLRLVGAIVSNLEKGNLQIVVYKEGDRHLAKKRALLVKATLLDLFPAIDSNRIQLSWFGTREVISRDGKHYSKRESVRFFLTDWK